MSRDTSRRPEKGSGGIHLPDVIWIILVTLLTGILLRMFVVGVIRVPSPSMEATLLPGDVVLLSKLPMPTFKPPAIGDVVAIRTKLWDARKGEKVAITIVKRCIAVAGDTLVIRDGRLIVNGADVLLPPSSKWRSPQHENGASPTSMLGPFVIPRSGDEIPLTAENLEQCRTIIEGDGNSCGPDESGRVLVNGVHESSYRVRKDYCFIVGDNERESVDSRILGYFPIDAIIGKVILVFWSVVAHDAEQGLRESPGSIRWHRIGTFVR